MRPSPAAGTDADQVRTALRAAPQQARGWLRTAERDALAGLRTAGRQAGPLNGVLGWWAVTSFGVLSLLLAVLAGLWPSSVRMFGAAAAGSWLLFVALGRFGGGQLLRARYGGPRLFQSGAALLAVAGLVVVQLPAYDPAVAVAAISLALGIAAAGDAGAAARFPGLARGCLRLRAACGVVAAMAVAVAPTTGLVVAAACVGLGELLFAVRLLPEVERLGGMLDHDAPGTAGDEDDGMWLPLPGVDQS
ncbi:hypothetical protein Daura_28025 [Dactylosporangium aurantiacum]|uniref:Uncharacterized protein n=1 Tax=Dactylosporangium aurantiacum TaxID=35754 RepID=A0A9Q9MI58_9ACTN|nr:hypothetical protein [Dactylosporangium aurantiacum]MDG6106973.1 hypothetical protein [Dactylosporangium aurantiacum]UWZ50667.1 hypothetical protein Daura_28025 [Dactylosporangium aurantiacum]